MSANPSSASSTLRRVRGRRPAGADWPAGPGALLAGGGWGAGVAGAVTSYPSLVGSFGLGRLVGRNNYAASRRPVQGLRQLLGDLLGLAVADSLPPVAGSDVVGGEAEAFTLPAGEAGAD